VVLTDWISGISHPCPTAEWITYSHGAVIDYARLVHRENAIGGELRHSGNPEAGRVTVTDAAGRLRIDYAWETLTVTAWRDRQRRSDRRRRQRRQRRVAVGRQRDQRVHGVASLSGRLLPLGGGGRRPPNLGVPAAYAVAAAVHHRGISGPSPRGLNRRHGRVPGAAADPGDRATAW
jgi:hypothetical protein